MIDDDEKNLLSNFIGAKVPLGKYIYGLFCSESVFFPLRKLGTFALFEFPTLMWGAYLLK